MRKNMKRTFVGIITAMMMVLSFTAVSYAATDDSAQSTTKVPKAVALVSVDNPECLLYDQIGKNLKVKISIDDGKTVIAEIPVIKVEEEDDDVLALWLGYDPGEPFTDDIIAKLTEIQKDLEKDLGKTVSLDDMTDADLEQLLKYMEEVEKVLEKIFSNYTVTLEGLPEDSDTHKFEIEAETLYLSNSMANELIDFIKEVIGELFELTQEQINSITKFSDVVTLLGTEFRAVEILEEGETLLDLLVDNPTDADRAEYKETLEQLDGMVDYMKTEDYKGTVITNVTVTCGCPKSIEYDIVHQYFKVKGDKVTLVGTEMYGPEDGSYIGKSGDTVSAKDFIKCDYNGETYNYIGSYDSIVEFCGQDEVDDFYLDNDYWAEDEMDSFVLSDDWESATGMVLRYELVEESAASAVNTGDDTTLLPYIILMSGAVVAMSAVLFTRRKVG